MATGWTARFGVPVERERRAREREHAAVGSEHPVAVGVAGQRDVDHGSVEARATRGAVERRAPEGERAAVGRDEQIAGAIGRGFDGDDRRGDARQTPERRRAAEREHAPVGERDPVAVALRP